MSHKPPNAAFSPCASVRFMVRALRRDTSFETKCCLTSLRSRQAGLLGPLTFFQTNPACGELGQYNSRGGPARRKEREQKRRDAA